MVWTMNMVRSCGISRHFVIIPQLWSSKDFSYNLIPKPFTLKFVHSVISKCFLIQFLFPKKWQNVIYFTSWLIWPIECAITIKCKYANWKPIGDIIFYCNSSFLSQFARCSHKKSAWPWPSEIPKVKCKYANQKHIWNFLFVGNSIFCHQLRDNHVLIFQCARFKIFDHFQEMVKMLMISLKTGK